MFRPNSDMFRGIFGLPGEKNKIKAYTRLTIVMCCQIVDRKSVLGIFLKTQNSFWRYAELNRF